jgi:HD superfamily phosphohydrolase
MKTTSIEYAGTYQGMALIADPIYRYASFTVPVAERDLIDSPWLQRLRRIYQLQSESARWVYPAAGHTRFQHSLGTMHITGEFGRHLR